MTAGPVGMVFTVTLNAAGVVTAAVAEDFPDSGTTGSQESAESNAEVPYTGDNQLVVTDVTFGASPATIAALIVSSPVTVPAGVLCSKIPYSSLGSPCTSTAW